LPPQIDGARKFWVVMTKVTDLNECNLVFEVVYNTLKIFRTPPFDCDVVFASSGHNPKWNRASRQFVDLGCPAPFVFRKMNISMKRSWFYIKPKSAIQKIYVSMKYMVRSRIRKIDEWVMTLYYLNLRVPFIKMGQIRVKIPDIWKVSSNIRLKLSRIATMQVSHSCCHKHNITKRKPVLED